MNNIKAVIIDDHPIIGEAYKKALLEVGKNNGVEAKVDTIYNLTEITGLLKDKSYWTTVDLVFLDISLPPSEDRSLLSGEDVGIKLRELYPEVRVMILTSLNDNFRIHNIIKNVDPDGLLVKNDIDAQSLIKAIQTLLTSPPFYSISVLQLLRKQMSNDFQLDYLDRRLLYELSRGAKMKDLPDLIPLSIAGIEKRKRNLKILFDLERESDQELIEKAREKGFI